MIFKFDKALQRAFAIHISHDKKNPSGMDTTSVFRNATEVKPL